MKKRIQRDQPR